MDPDATWKLVTDETLPLDERAEAALNLLSWLAKSGARPSHTTTHHAVEQCQATLTKVIEIMPGGTARMLGL